MRLLLLSAFVALVSFSAHAQSGDALVAYYPFSGDASNAGERARAGIVLGATLTTDRFGEPNSAYAFGEESAIYLGTSLADLTLPFAVSAWVYHEGSIDHIANVISSNEAGDAYTGFWLQVHDSGELELSYGDGGPRSYASRRTKLSSTRVPTDRWTHVVAVARSAYDLALYIDGEDAGGVYSGTGGAMVASEGAPGFIGLGDEVQRHNSWTGSIDEVRVYDRALDADEVAELFAAEGGSVQTGEDVPTPSETLVYPNPLTGNGVVQVSLRADQHLRVELLDVVGRRVLTLHDGWAGRGDVHLPLRGAGLASGSYLLRLETDGHVETRAVVIQ